MEYSRRHFLGTAAAGVGAMLLSRCYSGNSNFDPYDTVELGKTGIKTTRLCMGTGIRGGNRQSALTRMGYEQANALIGEVYNRGVRMFDMADSYGTHDFISKSLKDFPRSDYLMFTKMWCIRGNHRPEGIEYPGAETETEVMRFLTELRTDYIDGVQLHCMMSGNWNTEFSEYMTALDKLKERGIIRSHGVSCHSLDAVKTAVNEPWVDTIHVRINAYGAKMDDTVEMVEPVVKQLHHAGKGVIAMKVIGEGDFANSDEQKDNTFNYLLNLNAIDVFTIGMDKISDIEDTESRMRKVKKSV
jgi:aryl-alcohol dehydrogenase-like predicted oxidoreductase